MKDLISKYRTDRLTPDELAQSRKQAAMLTDNELDSAIYNDWTHGTEIDCNVTRRDKIRIKRHIDSGLGLHGRGTWIKAWHAIRIAAVIMLPLLLASTVMLYLNSDRTSDNSLEVSTPASQHALATLPDRTAVTLNGASSITYYAPTLARNNRTVVFNGEAYFDVAHDSRHPFVITTPDLTVTVLGTKFNLDARNDATDATLFLEEGLVRLTSSLTGETIEVHPNQRAVLNYADGHITVFSSTATDNTMAWINGKLVFSNEPLESVLMTMKKYYGCDFSVNAPNALDDRFTGTIPADDMSVAIAILEKSFGVKLIATAISAK